MALRDEQGEWDSPLPTPTRSEQQEPNQSPDRNHRGTEAEVWEPVGPYAGTAHPLHPRPPMEGLSRPPNISVKKIQLGAVENSLYIKGNRLQSYLLLTSPWTRKYNVFVSHWPCRILISVKRAGNAMSNHREIMVLKVVAALWIRESRSFDSLQASGEILTASFITKS